jgi:hypothetical protein
MCRNYLGVAVFFKTRSSAELRRFFGVSRRNLCRRSERAAAFFYVDCLMGM